MFEHRENMFETIKQRVGHVLSLLIVSKYPIDPTEGYARNRKIRKIPSFFSEDGISRYHSEGMDKTTCSSFNGDNSYIYHNFRQAQLKVARKAVFKGCAGSRTLESGEWFLLVKLHHLVVDSNKQTS